MNKGQKNYLIDVHHHIIPAHYVEALNNLGISIQGGIEIPEWSPKSSLSLMDENGIGTAIVSTPVVYLKDDIFSRDLARRCNEYSARLISDYPGKFGAFASLPFPDMEGTLKELEYAMNQLKLDGVRLESNVQGYYPGDPEYNELYEELNRRKMVVFIHPNDPPYGYITKLKIPFWVLDFPLDTTRTIGNLLCGGILERFPDIRFIFAHAGGTMPYLARRCSEGYSSLTKREPQHAIELLQHQYYEIAISANPYALRSLQELVKPSHILFGTDGGLQPSQRASISIRGLIRGLREYDGFDKKALALIESKTALELFPRFKG